MHFTVQYPLFFVTKGDDVAFVELKHNSADARVDAVPVFTDREAAEDFRDKHFSGWALGGIPDERFFAQILTLVRAKVFSIAFDPFHMHTRVQAISINVMLEQLTRELE